MQSTIVVTGIGLASPYGIGLANLHDGLLAGKCALQPSKDIFPGFQGTTAPVPDLPEVAAIKGEKYSRSDRLAMVAAADAVAGFDREQPGFRESGIVIASTVAGLSEIHPTIAEGAAAWYRRNGLARASTYSVGRVAASAGEHLNIHGPSSGVSVACASGAMAIALAANMLLDGSASMVLAGGSDALCPFTLSGFTSLQSLDPEACRPFDKNRGGLNLGEAATVLVLETLAGAKARGANILAVLRGWAMTNDASHPTAPHKQGLGLAECMGLAMAMGKCGAEEIDYVNAHGTGTPLNDIAETNAFELAFRDRKSPVPVSSTKSYIGHCLGSAGSIEAAITISSICSGVLFPTLRLRDPIESTKVDWIRGQVRHQPVRMAMSVSIGFGGSNAALLFGSAPL